MASLEEEQNSGKMLSVLESDGPQKIQGEDAKLGDLSDSKTEDGVEDARRPLAVIGISAK